MIDFYGVIILVGYARDQIFRSDGALTVMTTLWNLKNDSFLLFKNYFKDLFVKLE